MAKLAKRAALLVAILTVGLAASRELELEWWIVHRNRASVPAGSLDRALAELPAEIYQMPPGQFMEHARYRAEAMTIRDDKADQGTVSEEDWARIDTLLHQSWRSLWEAVRTQPA